MTKFPSKEGLVDRPQTIIELQTKNVKRVRAVTITPDGEVVLVGGKNGEGKSSTLDSIMYAFKGKRAMPDDVIRDGATEAEIVVKTQDLEIRRVIGEGGKVKLELRKDGVRVKTSAQTALEELAWGISFDPEEFSRMNSENQGKYLRKLINLDLSDLDNDRSRAFEERTDVNREYTKKKSQLDGMTFTPGLPKEEQSVSGLVEELRKVQEYNRSLEEKRRGLYDLRDKREKLIKDLEIWDADLEALKQKIAQGEKDLEEIGVKGKALKEEVEKFEPKDEQKATDAMKNIETTNQKIRQNQAIKKMEADVKRLKEKADRLTDSIASADKERKRRLASVDMPVDGLALDEKGFVTFNGKALPECSNAERIRVSSAIGLKANPDLPVMLIRNASLLDRDSKKMVTEMAHKAGAQVWMEVVTEEPSEAIIIEDGAIKSEPQKGQGNLNV